MGLKHLIVAKFKEGVEMEDIQKGLEELVSQMEAVKSFEWGQDLVNKEALRQGFTHAFLMTFESSQELNAYLEHPAHIKFGEIFRAAAENYLVLDFSVVSVKSST